MKSFSNEALNLFLRKFWASYILDLATTVWALQILLQKSTRNFGIKELGALENHVIANMLLCSVISQKYIKHTLVNSSKRLAYLSHVRLTWTLF